MADLPQGIASTLERLKKSYGFYITVKRINKKYYLYRDSGKWDKEEKRVKITSEYLGRILEDGRYVKKKVVTINNLEKAKKIITSSGGKISWPEENQNSASLPGREVDVDVFDTKILSALSMNARMPKSKIADIVDKREQTVQHRIKILEKSLGIRYLAEISTSALGFNTYVIKIKFREQKPRIDEIKRALANEPKIQFAAETKGNYDLLLYLIDRSSGLAENTLWKLRSESPLNRYDSTWQMSPISQGYGYIPLRDDFIEKAISQMEWKRSTEKRHPGPGELLKREIIMLKELNRNGNADFSDIELRNSLPKGTARYTYLRLLESGIIRRITITAEKIPVKYIAIIQLKYINAYNFAKTRPKILREIIAYNKIANKYALEGDIGIPNSILLIMPVFSDSELDKTMEYFKTEIQGVSSTFLIITNIIGGSLCYRRFDSIYSIQQNILENEYKVQRAERLPYT